MAENTNPFDATDPMQVAVKFAQIDGAMNSMQLASTNANQNLATAIQGLQQEVRDLARGVNSITQLEHDRQTHSEGLARAFEAIAKAMAMHELAWEKHDAQEAAYRTRIDESTRMTREKMLRWSAGSMGASLLIGTLVALVTWIYLTDKENNERDIDVMRAKFEQRIEVVNKRFEAEDARFDKIEGILIETCTERGKPCQFR